MNALPCIVCGEIACTCPSPEPPFLITTAQRRDVYAALDRWFAECEAAAPVLWAHGCSGHLGAFKLRASVENEGFQLHVERSIEEAIG